MEPSQHKPYMKKENPTAPSVTVRLYFVMVGITIGVIISFLFRLLS